MRIETSLSVNDYRELKKESKEVLGLSGHLSPPFGQSTNDYVEVHLLDTNDGFIEKFISQHTTFEDDKMVINIGQDLRDRDYDRGDFKVRYNFIRKVAGGDEIVLTKTVDGKPNIIHSGNPELTGVPMGQFYTDEEGNAFVGESAPANMLDAQPLDLKEWKFKIDEISTSRTEVRIVPQLINNLNYIREFRDLVEPKIYIPETAWDEYVDGDSDLLNAWNTISGDPDHPSSKWWRPRLQFVDNVTKKADFGKLHWNLYGKNEPNRNLPTQDGGGQISWTGPDSSRLEFNIRREVEDEGFKDTMKGSTITIEKAYIIDYQTRPDVSENTNYQPEGAIPELYIQAVRVENTRTYNYSMYTMDGSVYDPNSQGVQFYWDFGCGHKQEASSEPNASHTYDTDGSYSPSVIVMTPNFQSTIEEVRTTNGRVLDSIDTQIVSFIEPGVSSLDGKIIRWDCNYNNGIPKVRSDRGATVNSAWYVQNGYKRTISTGENFNLLRTLLGSTSTGETVQRMGPDGMMVNRTLYSPSEIELDSATIVSLPLGPDIDSLSFTTGISINESLPQPNMGIYSSPDENVFLGYFQGEEETQTNESDESIDEGVEPQTVFLDLDSFYQFQNDDETVPSAQYGDNGYTNANGQNLDLTFKVNGVNKGRSCYQEFEEGATVSVEFVTDFPGGLVSEEAFWTDGVSSNPRTFTMNTNITKRVRIGTAE